MRTVKAKPIAELTIYCHWIVGKQQAFQRSYVVKESINLIVATRAEQEPVE
jgi:hypothetical protein